MIVFHGTSSERARNIRLYGFLPRPPTRRVWFTSDRGYARQRARHKSRHTKATPVVLTCDLDLDALRRDLGSGKIVHRRKMVIVSGPVPNTMICNNQSQYVPYSPGEVAEWVNWVLKMKPHAGVSAKHAGVDRLSRWIQHRMAVNPDGIIEGQELLERAVQWIPEHFRGVHIDPKRFHDAPVVRGTGFEQEEEADIDESGSREVRALERLLSEKAAHRVRGLKQLAALQPPDLFEWCALSMDDEDVGVQVAALEGMLVCDGVDTDLVYDFTAEKDKRLRGAAIAVMARHADNGFEWFDYGLIDPEAHVRIQTARQLDALDPVQHPKVFEMALHDANPKVVEMAKKLTDGK